ncbi:MAG: serine/threonine-protein kinase, partial [Myxococcota bacterium]
MSSSISTAHSRISLTRDRDNIGPYQLVRRIGAGGMGEVYLAYDERLDRQVAVKRVLAQDSMSIELRNRFRREARVAAKINHPAVVQVYDLVSDGEVDCLVMEYVEGTTLRKKLADSDVSIIEVVELGRQIAEGMAEAHEAGIVHRDLK